MVTAGHVKTTPEQILRRGNVSQLSALKMKFWKEMEVAQLVQNTKDQTQWEDTACKVLVMTLSTSMTMVIARNANLAPDQALIILDWNASLMNVVPIKLFWMTVDAKTASHIQDQQAQMNQMANVDKFAKKSNVLRTKLSLKMEVAKLAQNGLCLNRMQEFVDLWSAQLVNSFKEMEDVRSAQNTHEEAAQCKNNNSSNANQIYAQPIKFWPVMVHVLSADHMR